MYKRESAVIKRLTISFFVEIFLYFFGKQSLLDYLSDMHGENMKNIIGMCAHEGLKRLAQDGLAFKSYAPEFCADESAE
jgi:hypothetical protein